MKTFARSFMAIRGLLMTVALAMLPSLGHSADHDVIAFWDFGYGSLKSSGGGPALTKGSGATFKDGYVELDGGANSWLQTSSALNLSSYSAVSFDFWIKPSGYGGIIYEFGASIGTTPSMSCSYTASPLRAYANGSGSLSRIAGPSDIHSDGQWHHVAVVYRKTSYPDCITLYVDGVNVGSSVSDQTAALAAFPNAVLNICRRQEENGYHVAGAIDAFRITEGALTAAEVAARFSAAEGREPDIALAAANYVTDGLVAMFDARENAMLGGAHDASASVWRNIAPSPPSGAPAELTLGSGATWVDGRGLRNGGSGAAMLASPYADYTVAEIAGRFTDIGSAHRSIFESGNELFRLFYYFISSQTGGQIIFSGETDRRQTPIFTAAAQGNVFSIAADSDGASIAIDGAAITNIDDAEGVVYIGNRFSLGYRHSDSYSGFPAAGDYYAVRLYDRRLTAAEVKRNAFVDSKRYFGQAPGNGVRYTAAGTIECLVKVSNPLGTAALGDGAGASEVSGWYPVGSRVALTVGGLDGHTEVSSWTGGDDVVTRTGPLTYEIYVASPIELSAKVALVGVTHVWGGASSGDFASAANWVDTNGTVCAAAPGADSVVVIPRGASAARITLNGAASIAALQIAPEGSGSASPILSFNTDETLTVVGDVLVGAGGTITCEPGKKLSLAVGGNLRIAADGYVIVSTKGYSDNGPGSCQTGNTYGGVKGTLSSAVSTTPVYGSALRPVDFGSGSSSWRGGGAIRLSVAGALVNDGGIMSGSLADNGSGVSYTGTGGSIWVTAASLSGSGEIGANGGWFNASYGGSGGRIAVELTGRGADFSDYTGVFSAAGGVFSGGDGSPYSGHGTIALTCGATPTTDIVLENVDRCEGKSATAERGYTVLPLADDGDAATVYANSTLKLGVYGELKLAGDMTVKDLQLNAATAKIDLNGHRLTVLGADHSSDFKGTVLANGGSIEYVPSGSNLGSGGRMMFASDGSGDVVHIFDTAGDFTFTAPPIDCNVRILVVGGGGAGGVGAQYYPGGGGGGGGVYTNIVPIALIGGMPCSITVGAGGASPSKSGATSKFKVNLDEYSAPGGGGGGTGGNASATAGFAGANGGGGGQSKAGAAGNYQGYNAVGEWVTLGQSGGNGATCSGGGGGGAGGAGSNGNKSSFAGGAGGSGALSDITGTASYYAGGGSGGSRNTTPGSGGAGGGGAGGGASAASVAAAGTDGLGGGGGGGSGYAGTANYTGGAGGCGCVIVRYTPPDPTLPGAYVYAPPQNDQGKHQLNFDLSVRQIGTESEGMTISFAYCVHGATLGAYAEITNVSELCDFTFSLAGLATGESYDYSFKLDNGKNVTYINGTRATFPDAGSGGKMSVLSNGEVVHIFDTAGDFEFTAPPSAVDVRVLLVGGGGAGGAGVQYYPGGGGGGGGVYTNLTSSPISISGGMVCRVVVGAGADYATGVGYNGGDTTFTVGDDVYTAKGGGGGGNSNSGVGQAGGNGGGGGSGKAAGAGNQQGYDEEGTLATVGKNGGSGSTCSGGGGGGAGAIGSNGNGSSWAGGAGGSGVLSDIAGETVFYAGGGGGGTRDNTNGAGGAGGGGIGGGNGSSVAGCGNDGFGGGGGGGSGSKLTTVDRRGGAGGCGCVIVRYTPPEAQLHSTFGPVEKNYASIRFSGVFDSAGKTGDRCDLYLALGPTSGELGEYRQLKHDWKLDTTFTYDWVGLQQLTSYDYSIMLVNVGIASTNIVSGTVATSGAFVMPGDENNLMDDGSVVSIFRETKTYEPFTLHATSLRFLVVGGGGGGGGQGNYGDVIGGGGGGGGGMLDATVPVTDGATYVVTVGAGGKAGKLVNGNNGGASQVAVDGTPYVGLGGGGGQSYSRGSAPTGGGNSGGVQHASMTAAPACQTNLDGAVVGYIGSAGSGWRGGNGGGAGGNGRADATGSGSSYVAAGGGFGKASDITGESVKYGGGGGGGAGSGGSVQYLACGFDGGGNGGTPTLSPTEGEDGLGGGGGGAYTDSGADGGSGIVVLRYTPTQAETLTTEPFGAIGELTLTDALKVRVGYRAFWAGEGCDYVAVSAIYGLDANSLTGTAAIASSTIGSGTGSLELPLTTAAREFFVKLVFSSSAGDYTSGVRSVTMPALSVFTPTAPVIDKAAKTIRFAGALNPVGFGTTTVTVEYGGNDYHHRAIGIDCEADLGSMEYGDAATVLTSAAISCDSAQRSERKRFIEYRYIIVETAGERELQRLITPVNRVRVWSEPTIFYVK